MKRAAEEKDLVRNRRLKMIRFENRDMEEGHFRKFKPLGCGHSRCSVCYGDKLSSVPTRQEMRADEKMKDEEE